MKPQLYCSLIALILFPTLAASESVRFSGHTFSAYLSSHGRPFYQNWEGGKNITRVHRGDEYSIVVSNPLPVSVAVAVSVDGLNTIDGEAGRLADGAKWIINAHSSITISGWQTGDSHRRRFVFSDPRYSYARWREHQDGNYYSHKLGEIKIAYFWNRQDLHRARYRPHHYYRQKKFDEASPSAKSRVHSERESSGEQAGTTMGARDYSPVYTVNFHADAGMYSERDALTIYYRFAPPHYRRSYPHSEPPLRYRDFYTPEMP